MMSVKEYATDMNVTVAEILKKCKELSINAKNADDLLSEDDIIILDNTINLISTDNEVDFESEDEIEEKVESIITEKNLDKLDDVKVQKLKKKSQIVNSKEEYLNKRKEMYKHKEKFNNTDLKETNVVLYTEGMTLQDLSNAMRINPAEMIKKLMASGLMISLNQNISFEDAELLAVEYNKILKREETRDVTNFEEFEVFDSDEDLVKRPPVVTIMGHVDHGKTTLLDYIRNSKVVDTEFGGITQHIGAYQIEHNGNKITFIDTPGHAAFTEMRARGASVTDIVIVVVSADDGVMPQTKEAIDHARSAKVPIIVAVNKTDKPNSNPDKVMTEMAEYNITPEEWGGDVPFVRISALTGEGVDLLLENILALAEINEYKANPNRYAIGNVIESRLDKNIGGVASLLVSSGTLRLGDPIVVGTAFGKIRTMKNDLGESILEAGPSMPVEITGLNDNPSAGDKFMAFEKESEAKEVAEKRKIQLKSKKYKKDVISLEDLFSRIESGAKEINVVLKADVRGSEEAVKNALEKIDIEGVKVNVIRSSIGTITESDVVLANASDAIILGFNVVPSAITKEIAKEYNVDIRLYTIIYKLVEDMESAMKGMLDPTYEEKIQGRAEVRQLFKFSKVGTIAGSHVIEGTVKSNGKVRVIRDSAVIFEGDLNSLQREKEHVKEVKNGMDCGITVKNYNDLREKDIIEFYEIVEVKK